MSLKERTVNAQEFEAGLKAEKYDEILTVTKDVGYKMGDHQHPFDACALITAGQIDIAVGGVMRAYKPGDVFRVPAGAVHTEDASKLGVTYLAGRRHVNTA
jgi:quercetin dioxygenase-like cupin family protein